MPDDNAYQGDITTEAEFEAALGALLAAAHDSGVTVERPWLCRTGDTMPDWEATVIRLETGADD